LAAWQRGIVFATTKAIRILKVELDGEDGVTVTFSDGTKAGYVVDVKAGVKGNHNGNPGSWVSDRV